MPAVRYEFVAIGADQVKAAFRGITAEAQASARAAQQSQKAATQATRTTGGDKAANDKAKAVWTCPTWNAQRRKPSRN